MDRYPRSPLRMKREPRPSYLRENVEHQQGDDPDGETPDQHPPSYLSHRTTIVVSWTNYAPHRNRRDRHPRAPQFCTPP